MLPADQIWDGVHEVEQWIDLLRVLVRYTHGGGGGYGAAAVALVIVVAMVVVVAVAVATAVATVAAVAFVIVVAVVVAVLGVGEGGWCMQDGHRVGVEWVGVGAIKGVGGWRGLDEQKIF